MNNENPVYSRQVMDLFTVANEFCIFIENAERNTREEVYDYLAKILPLLYLKGILLPNVAVEYPEANERFVTQEQWQDIFNNLRNLFGSDDSFLILNLIDKTDTTSTRCSLAENIADIHQDMKDFVLLFGKESMAARENAVNEIGELFQSHWGHRLIDTHRVVHYLVYRPFIESQEKDFDF